jgi:hypothetical protein
MGSVLLIREAWRGAPLTEEQLQFRALTHIQPENVSAFFNKLSDSLGGLRTDDLVLRTNERSEFH